MLAVAKIANVMFPGRVSPTEAAHVAAELGDPLIGLQEGVLHLLHFFSIEIERIIALIQDHDRADRRNIRDSLKGRTYDLLAVSNFVAHKLHNL